jgi:serine protease Do
MGRLDRLIALALFGYVASLIYGRFQEREPAPPTQIAEPRGRTPGAAPDPKIDAILRAERQLTDLSHGRVGELPVEGRRRGQISSGTAWAVASAGLWASARHVVEDCRRIRFDGTGPQPRAIESAHPDADVLTFRAPAAPESMPVAERPPAMGDRAFAVGFPQSKAGVAHLRLRGTTLARLSGRLASERPFRLYDWDVERYPLDRADPTVLGGISGGPIVGRSGQVIGVIVASSVRRAAASSISLSDLRRVLGPIDSFAGEPVAATGQFDAAAANLLRRGLVRRVFCTD